MIYLEHNREVYSSTYGKSGTLDSALPKRLPGTLLPLDLQEMRRGFRMAPPCGDSASAHSTGQVSVLQEAKRVHLQRPQRTSPFAPSAWSTLCVTVFQAQGSWLS